jgi:hypothetical protein
MPPRRLVPEGRPRVAVLLDERLQRCLEPELQLVPLTGAGWQAELEAGPVAFLLVGSPRLRDGPGAMDWPALAALCRAKGIPTALWVTDGAGGGPGEQARLFDHVFLARPAALGAWRAALGHERVHPLPLAAQPALHHPFGGRRPLRLRVGAAVEGGASWPGGLLDRVGRRGVLDLYTAGETAVPEASRAAWRGQLEPDQLPARLRACVAFLGLGGPDGAPRQVFESLACGTPVLADPSPALGELLGGIVLTPGDEEATTAALQTVIGDGQARDRLAQLGYREVQSRHTYADRLETLLAAIGRPAVLRARPLVSLICVSNRPRFLAHALANLQRQTYGELEVLFVMNGDGFDRAEVEERLAALPRARCLEGGAQLTLAHGLNLALDAAAGDFVAKIDDDDHYGPSYIADGILAAEVSGADIVGKLSHYCYLESLGTMMLRFPQREFRPARVIQGATILARRRVVERVRFTPVQQGTDTIFLKAAHEQGFRTVAADRFNFVYMRRMDPRDHTWPVDLDSLLRTGEVVGPGLDLARVFV